MRFDDYNYNLINEYVLIEDPQDPLTQTANAGAASKRQGSLKSLKPARAQGNLNTLNLDVDQPQNYYQHEQLTLEPSEYEESLSLPQPQ